MHASTDEVAEEAASRAGATNSFGDQDSINRRAPLLWRARDLGRRRERTAVYFNVRAGRLYDHVAVRHTQREVAHDREARRDRGGPGGGSNSKRSC